MHKRTVIVILLIREKSKERTISVTCSQRVGLLLLFSLFIVGFYYCIIVFYIMVRYNKCYAPI